MFVVHLMMNCVVQGNVIVPVQWRARKWMFVVDLMMNCVVQGNVIVPVQWRARKWMFVVTCEKVDVCGGFDDELRGAKNCDCIGTVTLDDGLCGCDCIGSRFGTSHAYIRPAFNLLYVYIIIQCIVVFVYVRVYIKCIKLHNLVLFVLHIEK
eukprot:974025_1